MDEEISYRVVTLPTCCLDRKLKGFFFGKNGFYLYDDKYYNVYEITQFTEENRSWFSGDMVLKDGSLSMVTRIEPLFLILPHLIASKQLFKTLGDIIGEEKRADIMMKVFGTNQESLLTIVEVKNLDDEVYYRLDEKKLNIWLKAKVTSTIKCLKHLKINVSTKLTGVNNFQSARSVTVDEKDYVTYAVNNLLSKYLTDDLLESLRKMYDIKEETKPELTCDIKPVASSTPKGQKRAMDTKCEPIDNYFTEGEKPNNAAKKQKLTRSQKDLEKASKQSGVISVLSMFAKKPTKTN